ncbi:hypothetical protein [Klebsiella aerogenes]|uniref:hypothetical protein n=1 Tax=Klebsiella aerogenes TaxID=548 RepID=UPI001F217F5F|nr:hypothetical protein [Klebsiella aerogenes]
MRNNINSDSPVKYGFAPDSAFQSAVLCVLVFLSSPALAETCQPVSQKQMQYEAGGVSLHDECHNSFTYMAYLRHVATLMEENHCSYDDVMYGLKYKSTAQAIRKNKNRGVMKC